MATKQKQNGATKSGGAKKTKLTKVPVQKNVAQRKKTEDTPKASVAPSRVHQIPKIARPRLHERLHLDPLVVLFIIFVGGAMFTLMISSAVALGFGGDVVKKAAPRILTEVVNIIDFTETDDGKIEALNGERYEQRTMFYPVAVMFDNHTAARPQSHLQSASIIYETLVEGSITRFMGVFDHGELDKVGPVRSARPYFVQWSDVFDAAYMHAGGSPEALQKIREYSVKDINQGQYYYRDPSRSSPHNLYTTSDLMKFALRDFEWADDPQNFDRWEFDDDPKLGSIDTGAAVNLAYSGGAIGSLVRWEYVPDTERYKRFQAGASHEDTSTGAQLTAKTIIVQMIPPIVSIQDKGRLELDIIGEGSAHILFNGKRIEGTWKKENVTSRTTFFDENGAEVIFPRGTMFVNVIPSDKEVTFE